MNTKKQKLKLNKFVISSLTDLSLVKGGDGDDDPVDPKSENPICVILKTTKPTKG